MVKQKNENINVERSNGDSLPTKKKIKFGTSSVKVNEQELYRAGVKSYRVQVKCCSNGQWKILYEKEAELKEKLSKKNDCNEGNLK